MVDAATILTVTSRYLGGHWSTAGEDDVHIRPLGKGFGNLLYVVELVTKDEESKVPTKVLFRKIGHTFIFEDDLNTSVGLAEQHLIYFHCGQIGLGPKIYGIYDQGRIEEFLYGRIMTVADYNNDLVSLDIARKMARFHCMQMPFEKKARDYVQMSQGMLDTLRKCDYKQHKALDACRDMVDQLVHHDYEGDLAWVRKLIPSIPSAVVFCHHDLHNGNILRLDQPNQNGDQAVLIDYELAGYGLRAVDIGYFFYLRSIDFGDETLLSGADYPTEDQRRSFIVHYLSECDKLGHKKADLDSVDGVLREVELYGILYALKTVLWLMTIEPILCDQKLAVKFTNMCKQLLDWSQERKKQFLFDYEVNKSDGN
ncbi:Choline/ethanolamine kinase [Halotydeus destructor]|nr:Choline/ethanolamine kinase [Halotydeus destructor]